MGLRAVFMRPSLAESLKCSKLAKQRAVGAGRERSGGGRELSELRLGALEGSQADQEARLRAAADALVRLSTTASLVQVAQAVFALVLSAIAAWLGRR